MSVKRPVSFIYGALYSYADLTGPGALGLLGRALDTDPSLRPSILDTKVPPRRQVESSAEVMAEAEAAGFANNLHLWWRNRGSAALADGGLTVLQPIWAPQDVYCGLKEDWLRDEEHRERLAAGVPGVGAAHDADVGEGEGSTGANAHRGGGVGRPGQRAGGRVPGGGEAGAMGRAGGEYGPRGFQIAAIETSA